VRAHAVFVEIELCYWGRLHEGARVGLVVGESVRRSEFVVVSLFLFSYAIGLAARAAARLCSEGLHPPLACALRGCQHG
jgi:hypothetical protein